MLNPLPSRGFTLVELLIGIALIGVLIGLGAPSMATYLQNSKIASAASNYYSGLQMARAEAIRRNAPVEFMLTNTAVDTTDLANNASPDVSGRNWIVRAASGAAAFQLVEAKAGAEGGGQGSTPGIQVAASGPAAFDGTIEFSGLGGTKAGADISINISNPAGGSCAQLVPDGTDHPMRCRQITVSPGGQVSLCDPAAAAGRDSRACP